MVTLYLGQWFNPSSPLSKPSFFIFLFPSLQHISALNPQFIDIQSFTKKNLSLGSDHPSKPHLCSDDSKESHMSRRKSLVATIHPHPTCAPPAVCPNSCDAVTQAKNEESSSYVFFPWSSASFSRPIVDSTTKHIPNLTPSFHFQGYQSGLSHPYPLPEFLGSFLSCVQTSTLAFYSPFFTQQPKRIWRL